MRRVAAMILAFMAIFLLAGCNLTSEKGTTQQDYFAVGDTAEVDGAKYTITNVDFSGGIDWDTPAEGNEYITVSIYIENTTKKELFYNSFDWMMSDSGGRENSYAFTLIDSETALGSGVLKPGETKNGTIVFEKKKNEPSLRLLLHDRDKTILEFIIR